MFLRLFMVVHVSVLHFFSWLNNIPLFKYTTLAYLFISWWTFVLFSTFGCCQLCCYKHLCATMNYLFEYLFSVILCIYPGMKYLGYMVMLCLAFWGTTKPFSIVAAQLTFLPAIYESANFPTSLPTLVIFCFCFIYLFLL